MADPTEKCKTGVDWSLLLIKQPQFAEKCQWDTLKGYDWGRLLIHQPQFSNICPLEILTHWDWRDLLFFKPEFHDKCPWHKLQYAYWYTLEWQPQFRYKNLSTGNKPYFSQIQCPELVNYLVTTNYKYLI